MPDDPRAPCPVPACDRPMPAGQVMCAHCWANVPSHLRRAVDRSSGATKATHVRSAIAAAREASR